MPNNQDHHKHDSFFKEVMSDIETAIAFFKAFLPSEVLASIQLDTLVAVNGSFISEDLKEYLSDMLFEVQQKGGGFSYLSLLIEHKSYVDKYAFIQLNQYQDYGYTVQRKNIANKPLQPIIPLLFYHGKQPWVFETMGQLIKDIPSHLERYLPTFDIQMVALYKLSNETLLGLQHGLLRSAMILQKHHQSADQLIDQITNIVHALQPYFKENKSLIHLVYLFKNVEIAPEILNEKLNALTEPLKDKIMSTYDMLIQRGEIKGKIEGKIEGEIYAKTLAAKNMIREGFNTDTICRVLDVTPEFVENCKN